MLDKITAAGGVIVAATRNGNSLRIECPFCRTRKGWRRGQPKFRTHGTGGEPGPWHRVAHCASDDLPPHLRGRSLGYEIVEGAWRSQPRE
jgi:hypothetical protein